MYLSYLVVGRRGLIGIAINDDVFHAIDLIKNKLHSQSIEKNVVWYVFPFIAVVVKGKFCFKCCTFLVLN